MSNEAMDMETEEVVYTEAEQKLLWKGLPKWPHLVIIGKPVTKDQAFEIILRTDSFLTDTHEFSGGNNRKFREVYKRDSGIAELYDHTDKDGGWYYTFLAQQFIREKIGFVSLNYIRNHWAASSYIGGPHGFCSPQGEIYHSCNVGKWPSLEDIYEDLKKLVKTWPFLTFKASVYGCEECEEQTDEQFVVSFVAENGVVNVVEDDFGRRDQPRPGGDTSIKEEILLIQSGVRSEHGLPWRWLMDYANIVKAHIPAAKAIAEQERAERAQAMREWEEFCIAKKKRNLKIMARVSSRKVAKSRINNRKTQVKK